MASQSRAAARYHGDQAVVPGMLDFAVNVRAAKPPSWLVDRLTARMGDLGRYPSAADEHRGPAPREVDRGRGDGEQLLARVGRVGIDAGLHGRAELPEARPLHLDAGDTLRVTCHHSQELRDLLPAFDGTQEKYVVWGEGTTDEMCLGILQVVFDDED